jgi:hypothetical protein
VIHPTSGGLCVIGQKEKLISLNLSGILSLIAIINFSD